MFAARIITSNGPDTEPVEALVERIKQALSELPVKVRYYYPQGEEVKGIEIVGTSTEVVNSALSVVVESIRLRNPVGSEWKVEFGIWVSA